ncbi:hypothetical protein WMF11_04245 [Sorangium sp. So ce295]|uniref:hypothetical protein n=1 Tax=Sorangium sp. So ce295 TaxID=3133295 RepID=UPI003F5D91AC
MSSIPSLTLAPELSAPWLDIMAASLIVSDKGAAVRGIFAPFVFVDSPPPVIADTRIELRGQSDPSKPWGVSLSTGYSSATTDLQVIDPNDAKRLWSECDSKAQADANTALGKATTEFAASLNRLLPPAGQIQPRDPSREALKSYAGRLYTAWQDLPDASRESLKKEAAALASTVYSTEDTRAECWYKKYASERMRRAYSHGWAIRVEGTFDFFPYAEGPAVSPDGEQPHAAPVPHAVSGASVTPSVLWFPAPDARLAGAFAYSAKRTSPTVEDPQRRVGFMLDIASNFGIGDIDVSGFQRGIAVGGSVSVQWCKEKGGCDDEAPYYKGVKTKRTVTLGGYVDLRAAEKLQLRIGVPITLYTLAAAPANSDGGKLVWALSPTLALSATQWVL